MPIVPISRADLRIIRGDSFSLRITVFDENGDTQDLSGGTVRFTVKRSRNAADTEIATTSAGPEIDILPQGSSVATNGQADIFVAPADSRDLKQGAHVYDVWVDDVPGVGDENVVIAPSEFFVEDRARAVP